MSPTAQIALAVERLEAGELVAFPTETVYGLGAHARNPLAIRRVFAAKGRPTDHPVIVHLASLEVARGWASWTDQAEALAAALWPGPLTLVLPRAEHVLDEVTGGRATVGLRVPDHPVALALLGALGDGVVAPSANRFGNVSPTTAAHVRAELGAELLILDGGPCAVGLESTIVDLSGPQPALLRPGGVPRARVEALVGPLGTSATVAPGTLPGHYAPHTSLLLSASPELDADRLRTRGLKVAVLPATSAQELYAALRRLDQEGVDVLVAEPSQDPLHAEAINDRLQRAARGAADRKK